MPVSIGFAECNHILERPSDVPEEQCKSLEVFVDGRCVISKWQFTDEEMAELIRNGGKIYLLILGETMPPVKLHVGNPFKPDQL